MRQIELPTNRPTKHAPRMHLPRGAYETLFSGELQNLLAAHAGLGQVLADLGMIGSKTKQALLWKHLRAAGVGDDFLATVRTPMGAFIGARSHEEIAVSVVSELIAVRRLGHDLVATWAEHKSKKPRLTELRDLPEAL